MKEIYLKDSLFLTIEVDLKDRFQQFEKSIPMDKYCLELRNILSLSLVKGILARLKYRKTINSEIQKLSSVLSGKKRVFITNCEGFIAINVISYIKNNFPGIQIIVLQHGAFQHDPIPLNKILTRKLINFLSNMFFKVKLFGLGFGIKIADFYIVHNSDCKNFLVSQGWKPDHVIISSYYLTGFKNPTEKLDSTNSVVKENALFFLQPLSKVAISTEEDEFLLVSDMIKKLSKNYKNVYIKHHPYAKIKLPQIPDNCSVIEDIEKVNNNSLAVVISFFSTALFDYEYLNILTVAIHSKKIHTNFKIYDLFKYIYYFDSGNSDKPFDLELNPSRSGTPLYYEEGINSYEGIEQLTR